MSHKLHRGSQKTYALAAFMVGLALAFLALATISYASGPRSYAAAPTTSTPVTEGPGRFPIKHIIIIDKENRSFDTMFGLFPGADGASKGELSNGKIIPLGHMPDQTLLDVGHAGAAQSRTVGTSPSRSTTSPTSPTIGSTPRRSRSTTISSPPSMVRAFRIT
jgi:phospholipase C